MDIPLNGLQMDLLAKIAKKEEIPEYYDIETKHRGESSFGTIVAVTIRGKNKKKEYILKIAFDGDMVRMVNPVKKAYLREIHIYENVFPAFKKFEEKLGVMDGFSAYPKIYGSIKSSTHETLILENLSESGFKIWNCKEPMDGDHVSMILKQFAKLHSVSLAMSYKDPDLFQKLTENLTNVFGVYSLEIAKCALEHGKKAVVGNKLATAALERQGLVVEQFVCKELEDNESKIAVIHNDGWCNNFMFKYESSGTPVEVNIIDWQLSGRGSPILDLSYFIFTCGSPKVVQNFSEYLDIYYKTLKESLAELSCDVCDVFPLNVFEDHWQKFSKFGLYMALIMIKIMLSEKGELADIIDMAMSGMSFVDRLDFESVNDEEYNRRVSAIINVMAEHELI